MCPSLASEAMFFSQYDCPTKSITTETPSPFVILLTSAAKSCVL